MSEPLVTITYLPTVEDYIALRQREQTLRGRFPALRTVRGKNSVSALLAGVQAGLLLLFFFMMDSIFASLILFFLALSVFVLFALEELSYLPAAGKLRAEYADNKGQAASQNIFIREEGIEFQSVSEQADYPWELLTDWQEDPRGFLLCFGSDRMKFIPARTMNERDQSAFRELLQGRSGPTK